MFWLIFDGSVEEEEKPSADEEGAKAEEKVVAYKNMDDPDTLPKGLEGAGESLLLRKTESCYEFDKPKTLAHVTSDDAHYSCSWRFTPFWKYEGNAAGEGEKVKIKFKLDKQTAERKLEFCLLKRASGRINAEFPDWSPLKCNNNNPGQIKLLARR